MKYLGGGSNHHAIVVSDDAMKLLDGQIVLDVRLMTPLLENVHTHLYANGT